jgi:hypothetical protein
VPYIDQVNWSTNYTAGDTSFTVDTVARFALGDLVRVVNTDEVILITAKLGNIISGIRDYGQATETWTASIAAVLDNAYFQIIGNAFKPGATFPTARHTLPVERVNFCQDVRTPIEMPEDLVDMSLRTGNELTYQEKKANEEHHQKLEMINFWGKPYRGDNANYDGTTLEGARTAGGLNHFLSYYCTSDHIVDQDDLTEYEFLDFLEVLFDKGSDEKVMYAPNPLLTAMMKWGLQRVYTSQTTKRLGMNVTEWELWGKVLYVIRHDMLKRNASTEYNYCFGVDMANLAWVTYGRNGSTRLRPAGNHDSNGKTIVMEEYETVQGMEIRLADTHGRLRFKTYSV